MANRNWWAGLPAARGAATPVTPHILLALVVALLANSSLAMTTAAGAPPPLTAKEQAQAEKEQAKQEAEAKKARTKCDAKGVLPCAPTVTLSWTTGVGSDFCLAVASVVGFAPGSYGWTMRVPAGGLTMDPVDVGANGTGQQVGHVAFPKGESWFAEVNGLTSAPSTVAC